MDFKINSLLQPLKVPLSSLLLDPNNPRFSELGEAVIKVPEQRFFEPKVQSVTQDKMRDQRFAVSELRDTIKTVGFLPMDRIVVRPWKGNKESAEKLYVVVEGNRRVTALKWLVELHEEGKETFADDQLINFSELECLLLDSEHAHDLVNFILPGLRHVSGIKEWGPYQKAKTIHALRSAGMSPQEAAQSLGLSTRAANQAYRCFLALEQMGADEEFGESAQPKLYSYFEEALKRGNVKQWLGWSDEKEKFIEAENLNEFYSWIVAPEGEDSPKLPEAKSLRELSVVMQDEQAFSLFRSAEGSLTRALVQYESDHPEDWYPKIVAASTAVKQLTPDILRGLDEPSLAILRELGNRISGALKDRELLLGNKN